MRTGDVNCELKKTHLVIVDRFVSDLRIIFASILFLLKISISDRDTGTGTANEQILRPATSVHVCTRTSTSNDVKWQCTSLL